jgi:hypothetical protein
VSIRSIYRSLPTAPRRVRRGLVLATATGYPLVLLGYATLVVTGRLPLAAWAPFATVLTGSTVVGVIAIYACVRGRADLGMGHLDERQARLRDRAWTLSYATVVVAIAVALVGLMVVRSTSGADVVVSGDVIGYLATMGAIYLPVLPAAVLAWIEPDAPPDDADGTTGGPDVGPAAAR